MHLLQDLNPPVPGGLDWTTLSIIGGIWSVVGIAFFVWYLWSLSKLFPLLGIKGSWGWIPVWNQWQLLQRGGMPGWLVLLALVPGLGALAVLVVMIIALQRINTEFGKGAGMTLLGVVIGPLWAMLLTKHITDGRYGAAADWAPVRDSAAAGTDDAGSVGGALRGLPHANVPQQQAPVFAQQSFAPQHMAPQPVAPQGAAPQGYQLQVPQAQSTQVPQMPQPEQSAQVQAPQSVEGGTPGTEFEQLGFVPQGSEQQGFQQQGFQPQGFQPQGEAQMQRSVFAPPVNGDAPEAANAPAAANAPGGASTPVSQESPVAPAVSPDQYIADPAVPAVPSPPAQGQNGWGFSNTTEGAYERLAAEGTQAPNATPLGAPVAQQPFSWPAPQLDDVVPSPADAPTTGQPVAPVQQPIAAPVVAAPIVAAPVVAAPAVAVPPVVAPPTAVQPAAAGVQMGTETAPVSPGSFAPADPARASFATAGTEDDFEEDDQTVVVRRETRWGLELPDGELMELRGHDVVVGRKPEPAGAYEVLKINDPTRTLSKSHVRLRRTGEVWTIEDLHSTNGVALIDETGATVALEAGHERGTTERMLIGTLEVRLVRMP